MTILIYPDDILPSKVRFRLVHNTGFNTSINNMVEVWSSLGSYWEFTYQYSNLRYANGIRLDNFINKLEGSSGEFMAFDPTHKQRGTWGTSIQVDGADQTGKVLNIKNAPANQTIAPEGDRFQLDNYLYRLTEDAVADSTGRCTLRFNPPLITLPTNSMPLIHENPKVKSMLVDNNQGLDFSKRSIVLQDFTISGFMSMRR